MIYDVYIMVYMKQLLVKIDDGLMNELNKLPNKSEAVREAILLYLEGLGSPRADISTMDEDRVRQIIKEELSKQSPVTGNTFVPKPPDPDNGYPCCSGRAPCKHWMWDNVDAVWKNSLTGKTREP